MIGLAAILLGFAAVSGLFYYASRQLAAKGRLRAAEWTRGALAFCISTLICFLVLETYFAHFHDQSDGFNLTLAGRQWFERHWKPINSLGYRDAEPVAPPPGVKTLVALGDSFTAGHGVDRTQDRYPDVLGRLLGPGWKVYNVAHIGWDTPQEIAALASFPITPDLVVLGYVLNDIHRAADRADLPIPLSVTRPKGLFKRIMDSSALIDFVYWRISRLGGLSRGTQSYWTSLAKAYEDPDAWPLHQLEIAELAGFCRARGIRLLVVIFPMLTDIEGSAPLTAKVARAFAALGVETVDLTPILSGSDPKTLIANAFDPHPSPALHAQTAKILQDRLAEK